MNPCRSSPPRSAESLRRHRRDVQNRENKYPNHIHSGLQAVTDIMGRMMYICISETRRVSRFSESQRYTYASADLRGCEYAAVLVSIYEIPLDIGMYVCKLRGGDEETAYV